jgi:transposase
MSRLGRVLGVRGVKPLIPYQHRFKNFYLFGCFSPVNGARFLLELPECSSAAFQGYLQQLSRQRPEEFKILFLDNGAFHHAKSLVVPSNLALIFLPPCCPELNPAEKPWRHLNDALGSTLYKTLDALSDKLKYLINALTAKQVKPFTACSYYLDAIMTTFSV